MWNKILFESKIFTECQIVLLFNIITIEVDCAEVKQTQAIYYCSLHVACD